MAYKTISLYKYIPLEDPEGLRERIRNYCEALEIMGRVLIGKEGVNASISGPERNIEKFKRLLKKDKRFHDLTFREITAEKNTYHKLVVRLRKEIVVFGKEVNFKNKARYITPKKLKKLLDKDTDTILLDARNKYEIRLGKFKNALTLPIETFREFPEAVKKLNLPKDKKIISYCTGGIRCEKAAAYLKEQGYQRVYQLKGGIIQYMNEFPGTHFEGNCFVFDDSLTPSFKVTPITECDICGSPSDKMINCHNLDCDKLFICCPSCQTKTKKHCSQKCEVALRHRPNLGIKENNEVEN